MNQLIAIFLLAATITGCGTIGGAVSGAGSDLTTVGEWIKSK
jgi:predicted small secreted protein